MTTVVDKWPPTTEPGLQAHLAPFAALLDRPGRVAPPPECVTMSPECATLPRFTRFWVSRQPVLPRMTIPKVFPMFWGKEFMRWREERGFVSKMLPNTTRNMANRQFHGPSCPKRIKVVAQNLGVCSGTRTRAAISRVTRARVAGREATRARVARREARTKSDPGREGPGVATSALTNDASRGRRSRRGSPRERAPGSGTPRRPARRRGRRRGWCRRSRSARREGWTASGTWPRRRP